MPPAMNGTAVEAFFARKRGKKASFFIKKGILLPLAPRSLPLLLPLPQGRGGGGALYFAKNFCNSFLLFVNFFRIRSSLPARHKKRCGVGTTQQGVDAMDVRTRPPTSLGNFDLLFFLHKFHFSAFLCYLCSEVQGRTENNKPPPTEVAHIEYQPFKNM